MLTDKIMEMNTFQKRFFSIFCILLVLSMPVTFSVQIKSAYVVGQNNVENILAPQDEVTIHAEVESNVSDGSQLASNLYLYRINEDHAPFDECIKQESTDTYSCVNRDIGFNATSWKYAFRLFYNNGSVNESSKTFEYYVNKQAPVVSHANFIQEADELVIEYEITDRVQSGAPSHICGGLFEIRIVSENNTLYTNDSLQSSSCVYSDTIRLSLGESDSGEYHYQIIAVDVFGRESLPRGSLVTIDTDAPIITEPRFYSEGLSELQYIGLSGQSGKIQFNVTDAQNVRAFIDYEIQNTTKEVQLSRLGQTYTSEEFAVVEPREYTVKIIAEDENLNTAELESVFSVELDNEPDVVSSLRSNVTQNGVTYIGLQSELTLDIATNGAGFERKNVQLLLGGQTLSAESCTPSGSNWKCTWSTDDGFGLGQDVEQDLSVAVTGEDDVGNQLDVSALADSSFIYDTKSPVYSDMTDFTVIGPDSDSGLITSFSELQFNISYSDRSPVTAQINMTSLGINQIISVPCSNGVCEISSGRLGAGPYNERFIITLVDILGNEINRTSDERVQVYRTVTDEELQAMIEEEGIEVFTASLQLRPAKLERTTSAYLAQRSFAEVSLSAVQGDIINSRFITCRDIDSQPSGQQASDNPEVDILEQTRATSSLVFLQSYNEIEVPENDLILFDLQFKAQELEVESLQFFCDVHVSGTYNEMFIPDYIIPVLLQFETYDFELGTLEERYADDLQKAKDDADKHIANKLEILQQIFEIARLLCQAYGIITNVMDLLNWGGDSLKKASAEGSAPFYGPFLFGTGASLQCLGEGAGEAATDLANGGWQSYIQGACQFVNCEWSLTSALFSGFGDGASGFWQSGANNPIDSFGGDGILGFRYEGGNKDNLVHSTINLCIPGIIANLEKHRQIKCRYALCLQNEVPQGVPKAACDAQMAYAECAFITGGIAEYLLSALPLVRIITQFRNIISDPLGAVGLVVAGTCAATCGGNSVPHFSCTLVEFAQRVQRLADIYNSITNIIDYFDSDKNLDFCDQLEDGPPDLDGANESDDSNSSTSTQGSVRPQVQSGGSAQTGGASQNPNSNANIPQNNEVQPQNTNTQTGGSDNVNVNIPGNNPGDNTQ